MFYLFAAHDDMRLKETHFDVKVPDAGTHKVGTSYSCMVRVVKAQFSDG